jgi:hypothetical protein
MKIGVTLSMGVADHVHRYTVDGHLEVRSVIRIEAAEENLVGLASAMMLADDQSRH